MRSGCVARPSSAAQPARRAKQGADQNPAFTIFGKTVTARESWGPGQLVHLHRFISPLRSFEFITCNLDAVRCKFEKPRKLAGQHS